MSLSLQVLDFYDDIGKHQLHDVAVSAPIFVKSAQVAAREEVSSLPTDHFALHILTKEGSRLKKYPTHTPADTWLSCAYFEKNAYKLPSNAAALAATNLKVACDRFGISPNRAVEQYSVDEHPVSNLYVEDFDMQKTASHRPLDYTGGSDYALNGRYPLFSPDHIKKAAAYFTDYYGQFTPQDRHTFASNLMKKANDLSVTLTGHQVAMLRKVAGDRYGDKVESQIKHRHNLVDGDLGAQESLNKIAQARETLPADKFAELLNAWDNEHGVTPTRTRHVLDPYEATFDRTLSKEAGYVWEDQTEGLTLTNSELEKAASDKYDKIKGYFGETLANSLKKHGSVIFESLPVDAKTVIARIAKGNM